MISVVGPCSWESKEQCFKTIEFLQGKVDYIRGGIWKYRSNPDTYQGNPEAIEWIKEAKILMSEVNMKFKGRKVRVQSGCLVIVKGIFKVINSGEEHSRDMSIQLMKESGAYSPDPTAEMKISGITVPPFLVPTK